jgi:hypothetical protein
MADTTIDLSQPIDDVRKLIRLKDNGDSTWSISVSDYKDYLFTGYQFTYSEVTDLGSGAVRDVLIVTPNTILWAYLSITVQTESEGDMKFYEAPTTSNDGTACTEVNRNRNSAIAATSVVTHTPTIAGGSEGTLLASKHWGSGKGSGGGNIPAEQWLLKANTKYLLRITNATTSANQTNIILDWHEHSG